MTKVSASQHSYRFVTIYGNATDDLIGFEIRGSITVIFSKISSNNSTKKSF